MLHLDPVSENEITKLKKLWYDLAKEMEQYSVLNKIKYSNVDDLPDTDFINEFRKEGTEYYFIKETDEIIGFIKIRYGTHSSRTVEKYLRLVELYITENNRNNGYGSKVIHKLKEKAKSKNCDYVKVTYESDNKDAERFYERNGFEQKQATSTYIID